MGKIEQTNTTSNRTYPYLFNDTQNVHAIIFDALALSAKRRRDRIIMRLELLDAINTKNKDYQSCKAVMGNYISTHLPSIHQELFDLELNTTGLNRLLNLLHPDHEHALNNSIHKEIENNRVLKKDLRVVILTRIINSMLKEIELSFTIPEQKPADRNNYGLAL